MTNLVRKPTRGNALLDVKLLPDEFVDFYKEISHFSPLGGSDHDVLYFKPDYVFTFVNMRYLSVYDMRETHLGQLTSFLEGIDWTTLLHDLDCNAACNTFYNLLHSSLKLLPYDSIKVSECDKPWITSIVKVLINKRWSAYRKKNWTLYHHYRQKVKEAVQKAKRDWGNRMKSKNSIWDIYKVVSGSSRSSSDWLSSCSPSESLANVLDQLNRQYTKNMIHDDPNILPRPFVVPFQFSLHETEQALKNTRGSNGTGPD